MKRRRTLNGMFFPPRFQRDLLVTLICLAGPAFPASALAQAASATPTPRVLVRDPFGVDPAEIARIQAVVAGSVKEAGGLAIRQSDFAAAAGGNEKVKSILASARDLLVKGGRAQAQGQFAEATKFFEQAVSKYRSVGAEVWRPGELAYAYVRLGMAFWRRDAGKGSKSSRLAIRSFRQARTLDPGIDVSEPEFEPDEVAIFQKTANGDPPFPQPPGSGFWRLAKFIGLRGVVEVRTGPKGEYALRTHSVLGDRVKSSKITSRTPGIDARATAEVIAAFEYLEPKKTAAVAVGPTPRPSASPNPSPVATASPKATPARVARAGPIPVPETTPDATPGPGSGEAGARGRPPAGPGNGSWVAVLGGVDRRASVYSGESDFTAASSGNGGALQVRVWWAVQKAWAVSFTGAAMQRSYLIGNRVQSGASQEAAVHALRSDDEQGIWWIGGGLGYMHEPRFNRPSGPELVPEVSRLTPGVVGMLQYSLLPRLTARARGTAGVGIELGTGAGFGDGFGYEVGGDLSLTFAVHRRARIAAGVSGRRLYTEFAEKTHSVEARRAAWLGLEAGF